MKLSLYVVPVWCLLAVNTLAGVVFQDDFNRSITNNTTVGNNWAEVNTGLGDAVLLTNQLVLKNGATAGRTWVAQSFTNFTSPFVGTLDQNIDQVIWNFNIRSSRGGFNSLSGFDYGQYGIGLVLASSSSDFLNATGYAVVWGQSGTTPLRLVRFDSGLTNNAALSNLIVASTSPFDAVGTIYLSVRVVYDPATDEWQLWARNDGTTGFADPAGGTLTLLGQTTNSAYTDQALGYLGAFWNYNNVLNQYAYFDNFSVQVLSRPPSIVTQPQNQLATVNGSLNLNVGAVGARPLSYQWYFSGTASGGQTNAVFTIQGFQPGNAGNYWVVVTNTFGAVTSAVATVTVNRDYGDAPDPGYPTLLANDGARHTFVPGYYLGNTVDGETNGQPNLSATGDDLNGINDDDGVALTSALISGQTAFMQVIASTNGYLNAWIDFNQNGSWADSGEQIYINQSLLPGVNSLNFAVPAGAVTGTNAYARFRFSSVGGLTYTGEAPDGEVEDFQFAVNSAADLSVVISAAPNPVAVGSNLTCVVVVSNRGPSQATGVMVTNVLPASLSFVSATSTQGSCTEVGGSVRADLGMLLSGSRATVTIVAVPTLAATITNSVTCSANENDPDLSNNSGFAVTVVKDRPVFSLQPQALTVTNGSSATFNVAATGTGTLLYQWRFKGTNLNGRTDTTLIISNAQTADAGPYDAIVSDDVGYAISAPATLTVLVPPGITNQPQSQTGNIGGYVIFNVGATGTAPLNYQWYFNASNALAGATASTLTVNNLQTTNAGNFTVLVANNAGSVTSAVAVLTIKPMDFGDAPSNYPTLLADNGARHGTVPGIYLGSGVSSDPDGKASATAAGDDLDDGVAFTNTLVAGQTGWVKVIASTNGYLNAWMDFSQDGSWSQASDQIFNAQALVKGTNVLSFEVPFFAQIGATFARFRFTMATNAVSFDGLAADGEVEDYQVTVNPATAVKLMIGTQPPAFATAGVALDPAPSAFVADNRGNPVFSDNATMVTATRQDGAGTLQGTLTATANHGVAAFTNLYHTLVTNITIKFSSAGLTSVTSSVVEVDAGAASRLTIKTQPSPSATAGTVFAQQPIIRIEDAFGNLVAGDSGRAVTASRNLGAGTLQGTTTVLTTSGLATYSGLSHTVANTINLAFDSAGLSSATSSNIVISPTTATRLGFTSQPGNAVAGAAFGIPPVLKTQDQFGNNSTAGLAPNKTVSITLTSGTGPLQGTTSLNIGANGGNGTLTLTDLRIDAAGTNKQLTATAASFTNGLSGVFTVNAAAANKLVIATQPQTNATAGIVFAPQPVVWLQDVFGNVCSGDNSTVVSATRAAGSGTLQGTTNLAAAGGIVTFTNLSHTVATNITILFTSGVLSNATSSAITINPAAASRLVFARQPGGAVVGMILGTQPVIATRDAFGNGSTIGLPANLPVQLALTNGNGPLLGTTTLDAGTSAGNGAASFVNLEIDSAGAKQFAAAAAGLASAVSDVFDVAKANQTINFPAPGDKVYGDEPFTLTATASSGLTVQYSIIAGPLTISSNVAGILGAGAATIRALQPGDTNFNPATSLDRTVTVARAELSITADNKARAYGTSNPPLTGSVTGIEYGDNLSASYSTVADQTSPAGTYSIVSSLVDPDSRSTNYNVTLHDGVLTVTNTPPIIITDMSLNSGEFTLSFIGQSGLDYAVEYKSSLLDATWITFTNVTGAGGAITLTDPAATNQSRFYRIRLQ